MIAQIAIEQVEFALGNGAHDARVEPLRVAAMIVTDWLLEAEFAQQHARLVGQFALPIRG